MDHADLRAWVEPLHWGKQVLGIRVRLAEAEAAALAALVRGAWARRAPKRLITA